MVQFGPQLTEKAAFHLMVDALKRRFHLRQSTVKNWSPQKDAKTCFDISEIACPNFHSFPVLHFLEAILRDLFQRNSLHIFNGKNQGLH